ncbi:MAG: hypothetical protein IJZ45_08140 [Bacteroidaceae bacterium]|nr:hypothetical protein [Bacteroidaceae bacterium]
MMKTNNNTFSLRRVWMLMRWDFGTNWKVYAFRYLGLYLTFLCMLLMFSFLFSFPASREEMFRESMISISLLCFMVLAFRSASFVMERMISKEGRTTFLMLPASKLEKFVWRAFFASILFLFVGIVAFALADLTNYLLCLLLEEIALLPPMLHFSTFAENLGRILFGEVSYSEHVSLDAYPLPRWAYFVQSFGFFLFSLFILGGCYWHRLAGVKVLAGLLLIVWGAPRLLQHFMPDEVTAIYAPAEWVNGVFGVLSILCWILAYRLFCRRQIV